VFFNADNGICKVNSKAPGAAVFKYACSLYLAPTEPAEPLPPTKALSSPAT